MNNFQELSVEEMRSCDGGRPSSKTSLAYDVTYVAMTTLYYAAQGLIEYDERLTHGILQHFVNAIT